MSFGLLKHFKDSQSGTVQGAVSKHYHHIILGSDLGAVLKLIELKRTCPEASVRLICPRAVNRDALIENYDLGVTQLRSSEAVENIYRKFHNARILPQSSEASFYKDGKFHDFGGRAKPMEIKAGEDFFISKGFKIQLESLFSPEDWENIDQIINEHSEIRILESIAKTDPSDLVDKKEWNLTFKDYGSATAENLHVSISPNRFLGYILQKEVLTPELIDVCTATQIQAGISVTWKLDKEFFSEDKTLFIPQSMTHEWGHFLVEFEQFDYTNKEQLCHVLFLIHEEEPQTEDLGGKIRLMKRVLDRVFPDIEKHIKQEFIRFDEEMFISEVKDNALEQIAFDYPTLKFLGQACPMPSELTGEKFLSRTLLN